MAIAHVASESTSGVSSTIVVNKPAGTVNGHVMIAFIGYFRNSGVPTTPPTAPSGWTALASSPQHGYWGSTTGWILHAYWKVASSEGSSYTWTLASSTDTTGSISTYSGCHASTPIDVSGGNGRDSEPNATWNAPTVTLPVAEWAICAYGVPGYRTVSTPPSDLTARVSIGGNVHWVGDTNSDKSAGSYAPTTITFSSNCAVGAFTIGLKPASGITMPIFDHHYRMQRSSQ